MNGGHGGQNNPGRQLWVSGSHGMLSHDQFRENQRKLAEARARLLEMERENEEGYNRFLMAEQELRNRVEQGRDAEYVYQLPSRVFALTVRKANVDANSVERPWWTVSNVFARVNAP